MLKSNRYFQVGVKEFILGNNEEAIKMFNKSICFHRGQYLSYWNLGRIYRIQKNKEEANKNLKITLELINNLDFENIKNIKVILKNEINDNRPEKYSSPITSLNIL